MALDLASYDAAAARLDLDYVRIAGEAIRARLFPTPARDGLTPVALPVALSYMPDNGTAYDLVFVPVRSIQQVNLELGNGWSVPAGCFDDEGLAPGYVLVAGTNGDRFAYPFDLSFGARPHCSYVREHTALGDADSAAVTALLRAIAGVDILDEPHKEFR